MARKVINKVRNTYEKFQVRGAIKEIMRNYGLRTISLSNYEKFTDKPNNTGIHSVKYDIMNGYIHLHSYKENGKCGLPLDSVSMNTYNDVYSTILTILKNEEMIPTKIKRNILVRVNR